MPLSQHFWNSLLISNSKWRDIFQKIFNFLKIFLNKDLQFKSLNFGIVFLFTFYTVCQLYWKWCCIIIWLFLHVVAWFFFWWCRLGAALVSGLTELWMSFRYTEKEKTAASERSVTGPRCSEQRYLSNGTDETLRHCFALCLGSS